MKAILFEREELKYIMPASALWVPVAVVNSEHIAPAVRRESDRKKVCHSHSQCDQFNTISKKLSGVLGVKVRVVNAWCGCDIAIWEWLALKWWRHSWLSALSSLWCMWCVRLGQEHGHSMPGCTAISPQCQWLGSRVHSYGVFAMGVVSQEIGESSGYQS